MKKTKKDENELMPEEIIQTLDRLAKEKGINKENMLHAIENALAAAAKEHIKKVNNDDINVECEINKDNGSIKLYTKRMVVDEIMDFETEISQEELMDIGIYKNIGDYYCEDIDSAAFSRINTNKAKSTIMQALREEEKSALYKEYAAKRHEIMTGTVTRQSGDGFNINLGRLEAYLPQAETILDEALNIGDRVKVFISEVIDTGRIPKIKVSRAASGLVECLFRREVLEIQDGTVVIKNIVREAGSRSKMAVYSTEEEVDPVGACVGLNSTRVNAVVDEIGGEKIDIVRWDENPAQFIENALSPAKVIGVWADEEENEAIVIVPDYQLSLAIGNKGQNVRLAAKLTNYKIDIHSETQARESGLYEELGVDDGEFVGYTEEYDDASDEFEDTEIIEDDTEDGTEE